MTRDKLPQALADALAGNVRVFIGSCEFTQTRVRNVLAHNGVPVIWERSASVRVTSGRLTMEEVRDMSGYEFLWRPGEANDGAWGIPVPPFPVKPPSMDSSGFGR